MRGAAIQFRSGPEVAENLTRIAALARRGADGGAGLLVLPEASMRSFGGEGQALVADSEPIDGRFVEGLVGLAAATDTTIVAGMFETSPEGGLPYNTTVAVDAGGLRASYRKLHLYYAAGFIESSAIQPGEMPGRTCTLDLGEHTLGIATCFDLRFPEQFRLMAQQGATLIALGAAWVPGPAKELHWMSLLQARAIECEVGFVAAAQPAPRYCGRSSIVSPVGELMAQAPVDDEDVIVADLSIEEVDAARSRIPVLESARFRIEPAS
jgi:predicted amidohydrolase